MEHRSSKRSLARGRIAAFLSAALLSLIFPVSAEPISGRASVIDGDTLDIHGQRFRLQGVDTPESAQLCQDAAGKDYRCGQVAANALADRIGQANVACDPIETDRYGRTAAICRLGALDLNGWLVEQGLGLAYRTYSTAYVAQEDAARIAKRGMWQGAFIEPWDWRKARKHGSRHRPGAARD